MTTRLYLALCAVAVHAALAVLCLVDTTPQAMTAFAFVGVPAFLVGAAIYLGEVFAELRRRRVL